jgi:hypothetical protein
MTTRREAKQLAAAEVDLPPELKTWFTTAEAAKYLCSTPAALRMAIARGRLVPDSFGGQGRARTHMFKRPTLDRYFSREK